MNKNKTKTKREGIIIVTGFFLAIITIVVTVFLISLLSRNLNRFISASDASSSSEIIKFDFEAYNALGF